MAAGWHMSGQQTDDCVGKQGGASLLGIIKAGVLRYPSCPPYSLSQTWKALPQVFQRRWRVARWPTAMRCRVALCHSAYDACSCVAAAAIPCTSLRRSHSRSADLAEGGLAERALSPPPWHPFV